MIIKPANSVSKCNFKLVTWNCYPTYYHRHKWGVATSKYKKQENAESKTKNSNLSKDSADNTRKLKGDNQCSILEDSEEKDAEDILSKEKALNSIEKLKLKLINKLKKENIELREKHDIEKTTLEVLEEHIKGSVMNRNEIKELLEIEREMVVRAEKLIYEKESKCSTLVLVNQITGENLKEQKWVKDLEGKVAALLGKARLKQEMTGSAFLEQKRVALEENLQKEKKVAAYCIWRKGMFVKGWSWRISMILQEQII